MTTELENPIKIHCHPHTILLHRAEVTHVVMSDNCIVPIGKVFAVMDAMHTTPVSFLLEGWTEGSKFQTPQNGPTWLDLHRAKRWWAHSERTNQLHAGNYSPFLVVERVVNEKGGAA